MDNTQNKPKITAHYFLENKSIIFNIIRIAFPTFILMFLLVMNSVIDSIMVVNFTSDYYGSTYSSFSIGSSLLSLIAPYNSIFSSFLYIIVIGTSILYSDYLGSKKDKPTIQNLLKQSFIGTMLLSLFLLFLMMLSAPLYSNYVLSKSPIFSANKRFYQREMIDFIILTGLNYLVVSINQNFLRIIRIEGHLLQATLISMSVIIFNPLLDFLFLFVFNTGIAGAAAATMFSSFFSFLIFLAYTKKLIKQDKTYITFAFDKIKFNKTIILIMVFGSASIFRRILGAIDQVFLTLTTISLKTIGSHDQELWSSFLNAAIKTNALFVTSGLAISQSSSQMISYYNSQEEHTKVRKTMVTSFFLIVGIQLVLFFFSTLFAVDFLSFFGIKSIKEDAQLKHILFLSYLFLSIGFLLESFVLIPNAYFNSTKQPKKSFLLVSLTRGISYISIISIFYLLFRNSTEHQYLFFLFYVVNGIITFSIVVPYTFYYVFKKERTWKRKMLYNGTIK